MIFRLYHETRGRHVHSRLFAGARDGALGKCGDLCMRVEEFAAFREATPSVQYRPEPATDLKEPEVDPITAYWLEHYVSEDPKPGHCSLCGNSGRIDTTRSAITPTGLACGRINFCICPNGQSLREHGAIVGRVVRIEDGGER